jgi:energy-coupling factor transport system permease protein
MSPDRRARPAARIAYHPGASFLHRLHPLAKVAWLVFGTLIVFLIGSPWVVAAAVVLLLLGLRYAGVRPRGLRGMRLFASTAALLGVLQIIFVRSGEVLLQLGPIAVSSDGLRSGVYVAARFLSVILLSYVFVLTTEPNDLAYGLMRAGLPYRFGFTLITALRMVPIFEQEGQIVYNAQLARGVRYDIRSPRRFLTLARQFFLPLLVSALGKVDVLAVSMEGRCFGKHRARTFLREVRATWRDGVAAGLLVAVMGAIVWGRVAG